MISIFLNTNWSILLWY